MGSPTDLAITKKIAKGKPKGAPEACFDRLTIQWVNSLSNETAIKVLALIKAHQGSGLHTKQNWKAKTWIQGTVTDFDLFSLTSMVESGPAAGLDGDFWSNWATCTILKHGKHERHMFNLAAKSGKVATPGAGSQGMQLQQALGGRESQEWIALKAIPRTPAVAALRSHVKVWPHHLACKANPVGGNIPLDAGQGGSVDHLCGSSGCIIPEHCIACPQHKVNTDRIGCEGIMLHYMGSIITAVYPCPHQVGEDLFSCCHRLQLVEAPSCYKIADQQAWDRAIDRHSRRPNPPKPKASQGNLSSFLINPGITGQKLQFQKA